MNSNENTVEFPAYPSIGFSSNLALKAAVLALLCLIGCSVAVVLVLSEGNIVAALALLLTLSIVVISVYRVDIGFLLLIGMVLLCDQFYIPGFEPITLKVSYFRNLKEVPFLPSFSAGVMNPVELQFALLLFVWFIIAAVKKELKPVPVLFSAGAIALYLGIIGFLTYGLKQDGQLLPALWEVRAFFYLGIVYFFVPQILRTKEQLHALMWVCIFTIAFKAFQGVARYVMMGFTSAGFMTLTNHEDPVFVLTLVVFLFALVTFNADTNQRWVIILLLLPMMLGFYVAQRRAAYASIVPVFVTFFAFLSSKTRWMFLRTMAPVVLLLVLYVVVFWESDSRLAAPLRLVKTGLSSDREEAGERYYSNLYREIEKYDLARTVQRSPVFGIGFGNKYDQPLPLVPIDFPLRDYIPHNEVLWFMVKTGAVGFFLLWFFLNGFAFNATHTFLRTHDPYLKALCVVAVCAVVNQIVVSYFDLQLTYYRNMIYLGTLMGTVSAVDAISRQPRKLAPEVEWEQMPEREWR